MSRIFPVSHFASGFSRRLSSLAFAGALLLLAAPACQAEPSDAGGDGDGGGDGDAAGDGDTGGDGDIIGDGDTSGDGDTGGDGDVIGDGDGDISGDGDGDVVGDGDVGGDGDISGDGDAVGCTEIYLYGLNVRVIGGGERTALPYVPSTGGALNIGEFVEAPTGGAGGTGYVCTATVVAVEGDYSETLECSLARDIPGDCMCHGAGERAGVYEVTATLDGQTDTRTVEVVGDLCHVTPVEVTFFGPR